MPPANKIEEAKKLMTEGHALRMSAKMKSEAHGFMRKFEKAYDLLESIESQEAKELKGQCLANVGYGLMNLGAHREAIGVCEKALSLLSSRSGWNRGDCWEH